MRVVKKCYICVDAEAESYCIVHLPNATETEIIEWFTNVFMKSNKLHVDFQAKCEYHWAEEETEESVTFLADDFDYVLTKWHEVGNEDNFIYSVQEFLTKGEFFVDILKLGYKSDKFRFAGLSEYSEWLFNNKNT